jgi:chorismate mutase
MSTPTISEPAADQPADPIGALRKQIDALDADILRIVAQRAALSGQVQAHRIASGGVRLELGRERAIIETYRQALNDAGVPLANAVLRACRGAL